MAIISLMSPSHLLRFCASTMTAFALTACGSNRTPQIDVDLLASDRSVRVGDEVLTLPYVALSNFAYRPMSFSLRTATSDERAKAKLERQSFLARAVRRETAPALTSIAVSISTYANYGELGQSFQICPLLKSLWSLSICDDAYSPIYQALPKKFELIELGNLEKYKSHYFAAIRGRTVYDLVSKLSFQDDFSSVSCLSYDEPAHGAGRTCRAGRLVGNRLVAIWEAWERQDGHETMQQKANREGSMIAEFVQKGLGPAEDFEGLERSAVKLRSLDALTWSDGTIYSAKSAQRIEGYGLKIPEISRKRRSNRVSANK